MSLSEEERIVLVKYEYEKALKFYAQAEKNAEFMMWDVVANRLYYAVFHAISALLVKDQHKVSTHKGAVLLFGLYYVKTGIFSDEDGRLYSQLQTIREKSDYNCVWEASMDDVKPMMPLTKHLMEKVKERLSTDTM